MHVFTYVIYSVTTIKKNRKYFLKWFVRVVTITCSSPPWVRIPPELWIISCEEQRNVGYTTQVPVRTSNNAHRGTWGLPPPVKLEIRHINFTVLVWRKTIPKKKWLDVFKRIKVRNCSARIFKHSIKYKKNALSRFYIFLYITEHNQ